MKRVLITGANGLLGQKLITTLIEDFEILATSYHPGPRLSSPKFSYRSLDITEYRECKNVIREFQPDVVINAAAYTNVDGCEEHKDLCWRVNVKGVENLLHACRNRPIHFVHISTDYIFNGQAGPYPEQARPEPLCYYGKAKLASENAVIASGISHTIVRTSVIYGTGVGVKPNFFLWVVQSLRKGEKIRVVTDQWNTPTLVDNLAEGIHLAVKKPYFGVIHIAGPDFLNRYEMATEIARVFQLDTSLISPITTADLHQKAVRPVKGGLVIDKARQELGYQPLSFSESLHYLKSLSE